MNQADVRRRRRKGLGWRGRVLMLGFLALAVVFLPTTVMLFFAMLPTVVAGLIDRTPQKTKAMTVGFMNFAGTFPFWLDLITSEHTMSYALTLVFQPMVMVVIYASAGVGYVIDWAMTGIVANLMVQVGQRELKRKQDELEEMVRRWGPEVTGELELDAYGFPVQDDDDEPPVNRMR